MNGGGPGPEVGEIFAHLLGGRAVVDAKGRMDRCQYGHALHVQIPDRLPDLPIVAPDREKLNGQIPDGDGFLFSEVVLF